MKSAVIFFHSNIKALYKDRWIEKCIASIRDQTMQDFDVFEINYSGDNEMLCEIPDHEHYFFTRKLDNHIQAMNFILNKVFSMGYDVAFNTNIDDYYHPRRFEKQLALINKGFDIVSSNFNYISDQGGVDGIFRAMDMCRHGDIRINLIRGHNVIAHPCVAYSRQFWDNGFRYNESLIGSEDLDLWKRSIDHHRFYISPEYLLFYRIHDNQITKEYPIHQKKYGM